MSDRADIDAAKVAALCDVLKVEMPRLVEAALRARLFALPKIVADLSGAVWETLVREENQRRRESKR